MRPPRRHSLLLTPLPLLSLLLLLASRCPGVSVGQTSTGTSSSAVLPFVQTFTSRYPIDWSTVPTDQPALEIPDNEELGPCICDLTVGSCDVNCACDSDCTAAEIATFSTTLAAGPKDSDVPTCMDSDLVRVNARGALTIQLVDNMICVSRNNNPSLGVFLNPPLSITATQFSSARSSSQYLYSGSDPLASDESSSSTSTNYLVGGAIKAAHQDLTAATTTFYTTNGGVFVVPDQDDSGECADGNSARYLHNAVNSCRRTVTDLAAACVSGGIFSGSRYVSNVQVGKIRTASAALTSQYVSLNLTAANNRLADGSLQYLGADGATSFTFPEPTWNAATCQCSNVLASVAFTFTYEAAGTISASPQPAASAVVTTITGDGSVGACGGAFITQTYTTAFQLVSQQRNMREALVTTTWAGSASSTSTVVVRPRSGNPGYLVGLPVLSGVLVSQSLVVASASDPSTTTTVVRSSIAQDVAGLTVLPTTADGRCTLSSTASTQAIAFGQDAKFACYLPLTLSQLQAACEAGAGSGGTSAYFGNISSQVGLWGSSDFTHVNEWLALTLPTAPTGVWNADTRTCEGLATSLSLDFATVDAGAFNNPQRRILATSATYSASSWRFSQADVTASQLFPLFVGVNFIQLPPTGLHDYVPSAPPLLPKFPHDLLYPLYIESAAPAHAHPLLLGLTIGATFALLLAHRLAF